MLQGNSVYEDLASPPYEQKVVQEHLEFIYLKEWFFYPLYLGAAVSLQQTICVFSLNIKIPILSLLNSKCTVQCSRGGKKTPKLLWPSANSVH